MTDHSGIKGGPYKCSLVHEFEALRQSLIDSTKIKHETVAKLKSDLIEEVGKITS